MLLKLFRKKKEKIKFEKNDGLSLKQIKKIFLEGESPTLILIICSLNYFERRKKRWNLKNEVCTELGAISLQKLEL